MEELNKSKKKGKGEPSSATICDMFDIVICLASEMKSRLEQIEIQKEEIVQLQEENQPLVSEQKKFASETRHLNDKLDELEQRGMKGNLLINCTKTELNRTDDELKSEDSSVQTHVLDLLEKAYDVHIQPSDIQAYHRLNKGGRFILRVWNRANGSAWHTLCNAILTGKNKQAGIYANFQLTNRRNAMSYHLRQLKKAGKIVKFSTNENGAMSFTTLANDESEVKHKITYTSLVRKRKSPGNNDKPRNWRCHQRIRENEKMNSKWSVCNKCMCVCVCARVGEHVWMGVKC